MVSEVLKTQNFCPIKLNEALRPEAPTKAMRYLKGKFIKPRYWCKIYNSAEFVPTFISNAMPYKTTNFTILLWERSFFFQVQYLLRKYVTVIPHIKEMLLERASLPTAWKSFSGRMFSKIK